MAKSIDEFKRLLRTELAGLSGVAPFDAIQAALVAEVQHLVEQDAFDLGHDHRLGGAALEARVFSVLRKMGITVATDTPDLWDAVLSLASGEPAKPCVLEVKSAKGVGPTRSDLRQLDDWVFELSGEEQARKVGLGGGVDPLAMALQGVVTSRQFHPSPHKGVMIFNGPLGTEFQSRPRDWLGANEKVFADKRDFAVVSFEVLLAWHESIANGAVSVGRFWSLLHSATGVLPGP